MTLGDAVLREMRPLVRIPYVLLNVRQTLPRPDWVVHFFHGPRNVEGVHASPALMRFVATGDIRLRRYTIDGRTVEDGVDHRSYQNYLKTPRFWQSFSAPQLLLFELDAVMCPAPQIPLAHFAKFAFVGAPWGAYPDGKLPAWCHNLAHCVGNSGFSLWRRDVRQDSY